MARFAGVELPAALGPTGAAQPIERVHVAGEHLVFGGLVAEPAHDRVGRAVVAADPPAHRQHVQVLEHVVGHRVGRAQRGEGVAVREVWDRVAELPVVAAVVRRKHDDEPDALAGHDRVEDAGDQVTGAECAEHVPATGFVEAEHLPNLLVLEESEEPVDVGFGRRCEVDAAALDAVLHRLWFVPQFRLEADKPAASWALPKRSPGARQVRRSGGTHLAARTIDSAGWCGAPWRGRPTGRSADAIGAIGAQARSWRAMLSS